MSRSFTSTHRRSIATVAAMVACCAVSAELPPIATAPLYPVFELRSAPNESIDSFIGRAGSQLRAFTDSTSFEACGVIASDANGFGLIAKTNRSQVLCVIREANVPTGMSPMKVDGKSLTIHTHPLRRIIRLNSTDMALLGRERIGVPPLMKQDPDHFSAEDIAAGPGYLATPAGVIYQPVGAAPPATLTY